jgi:diguanylate cyclase (GGDEF)-like protein
MQAKGESALMSHSGIGKGRDFARSLRLCALASLLFAIAGAPGQLRGQRFPELTTARAIRSLSSDQAGQARPVRLRGVVTAVTDWRFSFFVQDATSGIFVERTHDSPQLKAGQFVEVHGVTGPGNFAPIVNANDVTLLGKRKLPPARFLELEKLAGGKQDSQWIALRGIVRSAVVEPSRGRRPVLFLDLDIGAGNMVKVWVRDFSETGWQRLPGATISVRGVGGTGFNDKRQFADLRLYVSSLEDVKVPRPGPADSFDLPLRPLGSLLQFGDAEGFIQRVKVSGVVTLTQSDQGLYLQDGAQGVYVQSRQAAQVALGSRLEVVGFPVFGRYAATLDDALLRVVGAAHPVAGVVQTAAAMIVEKDGFPAAPYDSVLVQLKGRLIEEVPGIDEEVLFLQDGTTLFTARLPRSGPKGHVLAPGSLVSITGVCLAKADSAHDARSFEILLRSPADLVVLKSSSWWTAAHAWSVVAFLLLVVLGLVGWLAILRRQASLRLLAVSDHLTGLYNRRGFLLLADHQWQLALRKKMSVAIFYIDLDHFKEINDSMGHKEGDLALQTTAAVLRESFRKTDLIGRLGGDEFAIIAVDTAQHSPAELEQRLEKTLQKSNQQSNLAFQLALSVGILNCDDSLKDSSIEDLLARADVLMYLQKSVRKCTSATEPITAAR